MLIVHLTTTDPAGAVYNMVRAMNTHTSHRARLIATQAIPFFDFPRDIMDLFDGGDEAAELIKKADVIHLHKVFVDDFELEFGLSRGPRIIKISDFTKGKTVVHHIHGSHAERNMASDTAEHYKRLGAKILAATPDLEETYINLGVDVSYFPNVVPINDVKYLPRATDEALTGEDGVTKKYCVFQSGTNSVLKNMHVIRDVMEKLSKELPVFFLHTTPESIQTQDYTLRSKRIAHVVFDHIEGYYGLSSLEALSMAKPTIAGLSQYTIDAICKFFSVEMGRLPWIVARDAEQIEKSIRDLIIDHAWRKYCGEKGRQFMEEVWSDAAVARRLAEYYQAL